VADQVVENLIVDLLSWLSARERSYDEVMEAWRTSCPKLPVWEDANERGFVAIEQTGEQRSVKITAAGAEFLTRKLRRVTDSQI
jgi:D-3-phosphoglycerate dehydrogenase